MFIYAIKEKYVQDGTKDRAFHLLLETPLMLMFSHKEIRLDIVIQLVTILLDYINIQSKYFKHPVQMFQNGGKCFVWSAH